MAKPTASLVCALIATIYGVDGYDCPDMWVEDQGSCYLFVQNNPMTIYDAEHYCNQHHEAHLVQAETKSENDFLKAYMRGWGSDKRWIGLTDETIEGIWQWYTSDIVTTYTDWADSEPDSRGNEDCVFYDEDRNYEWADVTCTANFNPICEKSVTGVSEIIAG